MVTARHGRADGVLGQGVYVSFYGGDLVCSTVAWLGDLRPCVKHLRHFLPLDRHRFARDAIEQGPWFQGMRDVITRRDMTSPSFPVASRSRGGFLPTDA